MHRRPKSVLRRGAARRRALAALLIASAAIVLVLTPSAAADTTPPIVTYTIDATAGDNGWYRGSTHGDYVVVHWAVSDPDGPLLSTTGCDPAVRVDGPTSGVTRTCTATSDGGTTTVTTKLIKIDADPPSLAPVTAARAPDVNGWYNRPVTIAWSGSDATSGLAACTSIDYRGPDVAAGVLAGSCTDNAGNVASSTFALRYDATPPELARVSVASGVGFDVVRWRSSSSSDIAVVERVARGRTAKRLVFRGGGTRFVDRKIRNATEYRYSVQTFDEAGNASRAVSVVALPKILTLRAQPYVPRAAARPVLRWSPVKRATYYHVQLFRGAKRILAAWPLAPQLRLPARWTWSGRRYRLAPGMYRWYAWAGFGPRSAVRYRLLGSAKFIVP